MQSNADVRQNDKYGYFLGIGLFLFTFRFLILKKNSGNHEVSTFWTKPLFNKHQDSLLYLLDTVAGVLYKAPWDSDVTFESIPRAGNTDKNTRSLLWISDSFAG